jgi:hypothetical protein
MEDVEQVKKRVKGMEVGMENGVGLSSSFVVRSCD